MDTVHTNYGAIKGVALEKSVVYRGIPYAKAPVGNLRWQPPQKMERWDGIWCADTFPKKCPQEESGFSLYTKEFYSNEAFLREASEDCLYLNIWTPKEAQGKKLPVAFWIHGGGFGGGYGSELEFDGEKYCEKDVILVTIQYRVNIFGFLAHPWFKEESKEQISGNYGILDQIAALTWVYENIEAFGGDSGNITIFGQSAGSTSVQVLISSMLTKNMISKAIMQSAGSYGTGILQPIPQEKAEEIGKKFVAYTGVNSLAELRNLSVTQLEEASAKFNIEMRQQEQGLVLVPNLDGYVIEDTYDHLAEQGRIKDIPYMIGSTEIDLFVSKEDLKAGNKGILYDGCKNWSLLMEKLGRNPSYVYYFTHSLPGDNAGAFHSSELWYTFGTLDRCWRNMEEADYKLSEEMLSYWTNFMKAGNPNEKGLKEWEPCSRNNMFIKEFA